MIKFENKVNGRYYYLEHIKDLFNAHTLIIHRGGANYHTRINRAFDTLDKISAEINRLTKARLRRGYELI